MEFSQNLKAFLQQLPLKEMSGHQKFVAVAASESKGRIDIDLSIRSVKSHWRKSILRIKYNPAFYHRAESAGWVNPTGTKGMFRLDKAGLENLSALSPEIATREVTRSGSLLISSRKATHSFDKFLRTALAAAKVQVLIADSWVDESIFDTVLDVIPRDCSLKMLYAKAQGSFDHRARRFAAQFPNYLGKRNKHLHDRFMIVDESAYILGPSIKDAASNYPAIVVALRDKEKRALERFFNQLWTGAK